MISYDRPTPPTDDRRWKLIEKTMRLHGYKPRALIETLHSVQDTFGYLEESALDWVAASLQLPLSRVYGVATFYHYFTLKPQGEHTCVVCTGTACYIKGVPELLEAAKGVAGVEPGETTEDNKVTLLSARCVGSCGLAPVVLIDGETNGKITPEQFTNRLKELLV